MRVLLIAFFIQAVFSSVCLGQVLSFKSWKEKQVQMAEITLKAASMDFSLGQNASPSKLDETPTKESPLAKASKSQSQQSAESRIRRARVNLEVAKDLGPNDYFILYLAPQPNIETSFAQIHTLLEPSDLAHVLEAYRKSLQNRPPANPPQVGEPRRNANATRN